MSTTSAPPPYYHASPTADSLDDILQQFRQQNNDLHHSSSTDPFSFNNSRSNSFTFTSNSSTNTPADSSYIPSDLLMYVGAGGGDDGTTVRKSDDPDSQGLAGGYGSSQRNQAMDHSFAGGGYAASPTVGSISSSGSAFSTASSPGYSYSLGGHHSSSSIPYSSTSSFDPSSLSPQPFFPYNPSIDVALSSSNFRTGVAASNNVVSGAISSSMPSSRMTSSSTPSPPTQSINYPLQQSSSSSSGSSPSNTLSPYTPPNNFVPNEALVRMLASAQAQGQLQAQQASQAAQAQAHAQAMAQAAYNQSYLATLNLLPQQQHSGILSSATPSSSYQPPSAFYGVSTSQPEDYERSIHEMDQPKKRRVSDHEFEPTINIARTTNRTSLPTSTTARGHRSTAVASRKISPPPIPLRRSNEGPADLNFSLKRPDMIRVESGSAGRSSVEVIANAGITFAPDARKVYRDDELSPKLSMPRRGSQLPPTNAAPIASKAAKALAAAEKKQAKAGVKTDKRKKGDKGHNAVERRYRNNINNAIATLRDIVPALRHLKPLPSMPASRRRASQFTLSTSAQAPTPSGLIDGIPAAKTLSKGSILSTSIAYIQYLQGARADGAEDIEIFKSVVMEMVSGGPALIEAFETRRAVREEEREKMREILRREQAALDEDEEGSDDDEDGGEKSETLKKEDESEHGMDDVQHQQPQYSETANYSSDTTSHPFPPSPVSASDGSTNGVSPRSFTHNLPPQHQFQNNGHGPPRMFLGAFMGLSFAGGLGYDWSLNSSAESAAELVGAKAWAGRLVRRATPTGPPPHGPSSTALISSDLVHPGVLTGLIFLGLATSLVSIYYLLAPLCKSSPPPVPTTVDAAEDLIDQELPRSIYRQQRRADALASLAELSDSGHQTPSYAGECKAALKARRELLKLVGAPTYGLLPALAKEALATALRNVTTIRVGSFSTWSESDRLEAAAAWVRIVEIEAALGGAEINPLGRWYSFLRLFNLSRSPHWPQTTSSTTRTNVNALLALHLDTLNHPLYANALWNQAVKADRKKCDTILDSWTEIAVSTDFEQVRLILASTKKATDYPSPSDTVPLLRVSEARCEAALRETWAKIFVAVVQTQGSISATARFATIVDQPRLEETLAHVTASTSEGSLVHSMAKVTRALCAFYTDAREDAAVLAEELAYEARRDGPVARLGCASAFFSLLLGEDAPELEEVYTPTMEVDILASATLAWVSVRKDSEALMTAVATKDGTLQLPPTPVQDRIPDSPLPSASSSSTGRRALGPKVFSDPSLIAFCASPVSDALKYLKAAGLESR